MFQYICTITDYLNKYAYKLVDSNFQTELIISDHIKTVFDIRISVLVAAEYEKRNLNAAANLAIMLSPSMNHSYWGKIMEVNYENYPELSKEFYDKYLIDIKKYLLLM